MSNSLEDSYGHCQRTVRRAGSSFAWSFCALPRAKRRAMYALYAFARRTDDLGDQPGHAEHRRAALGRWRAELTDALAGRSSDQLWPAVVDTVQRFGIPHSYLFDLVDGVEMDTRPCRYETYAELCEYCNRVASVVGLACIHIWGFRHETFHEPAMRCGHAFQLTNILRDLKEDAAQDRIYLPQEDLRRFNYGEDDLRAGVVDTRFLQLMQFEIDRAEQLYANAVPLAGLLHPDGVCAFRIMLHTYRALLQQIKQRPQDVLTGSVRLSRLRKLCTAAAHLPSLAWAIMRARLPVPRGAWQPWSTVASNTKPASL